MAENTEPKTEPTTAPADAAPAAPAPKDVDWKAEADKRAAELDRIKADDAKRKAAAKKADEDKRAADGEAQKLYQQRTAELEEAQKRAEALEKATRGRIDKQIAKLPDSAQKRIALVKDALPLDKLAELVDTESEEAASTVAPPPASPRTGRTPDGKRKLSTRTYEELDRLGVSPNIAESDVIVKDTDLGGQVFVMPIKNLMRRLQGIAVKTRPLSSEQYTKEHKF